MELKNLYSLLIAKNIHLNIYRMHVNIVTNWVVKNMRSVKFPATLVAKVNFKTRQAVEELAAREGLSLGEVTRDLLSEGMRARGLMVEAEAL